MAKFTKPSGLVVAEIYFHDDDYNYGYTGNVFTVSSGPTESEDTERADLSEIIEYCDKVWEDYQGFEVFGAINDLFVK